MGFFNWFQCKFIEFCENNLTISDIVSGMNFSFVSFYFSANLCLQQKAILFKLFF